MPTLVDVRKEYEAKSNQLAKIFEEAGPTMDMDLVKSIDGDSRAKSAEIRKRNDELTALGKDLDDLLAVENAKTLNDNRITMFGTPNPHQHPNPGDSKAAKIRTLDEILHDSKDYAAFREAGKGMVSFDFSPQETARIFGLKTTLTLSDINVQPSMRSGIIGPAEEERTVRDLMIQGSTNGNTLNYWEETTTTNNADTVAEGEPKPESEIDFTERTDHIRKIATWLPATTELLSDVPRLRSYIEGRLRYFIKRKEESQLLLGDGTAPNISGIQDRSGIQTQAKGADPVPDAIYKAMQLIRNIGYAEPTAVVLNPNDWTPIRLLRTADGLYIWGSPSEAGPERIWGKEIRQTSAQTEGTGLVGAFTPHAEVIQREGITIVIGTEHSDFLIRNKVAIVAEERLGLAVYRPSAFATVTGI